MQLNHPPTPVSQSHNPYFSYPQYSGASAQPEPAYNPASLQKYALPQAGPSHAPHASQAGEGWAHGRPSSHSPPAIHHAESPTEYQRYDAPTHIQQQQQQRAGPYSAYQQLAPPNFLPLPPTLPSPSWSSGTPSPNLPGGQPHQHLQHHQNQQQQQHQQQQHQQDQAGWNAQPSGPGQHGLGFGARKAEGLTFGGDDRWSPQAYLTAKQHQPGTFATDKPLADWRLAGPPRAPAGQTDPHWHYQGSSQAPVYDQAPYSEPRQQRLPLLSRNSTSSLPGDLGRAPEPWLRTKPLFQAPLLSPPILGGTNPVPRAAVPLTEERRFHEPATPFIGKLHHMLAQAQHAHLIRWSANGDAFIFRGEDPRLSKLFERVWRTGQVKSFVRQLNIYSFDRAPSTLATSWATGSALGSSAGASTARPQLSHLLSGYPSPTSSLPSPSLGGPLVSPPPADKPGAAQVPPPADDGEGPWTGFSHHLFKRETTTSGLSALKPIAVKKRAREMEEEAKAEAKRRAAGAGLGGGEELMA